jgi:hypothetical protein
VLADAAGGAGHGLAQLKDLAVASDFLTSMGEPPVSKSVLVTVR